jgi:hypothetical protein
MSDGLHTVILGGGDQPLVHVPGAPVASATFTIEDLSLSDTSPLRVLAQGSATVDSLSGVTVGSVAGPRTANPRRLPVLASAAVVGRVYRLTSSADGTSELVRVEAVTTTSVTVAGRLSATYPIGSTLRGAEIRATFPEAAAARSELQEEDRVLRVRWSYAVGSAPMVVVEQVRVVRHASEIAGWLSRAEVRLREDWPELVKGLGGGAGGLRAMTRSCAQDITAGLRTMSQEPDDLFLGDQGFELLMRRCVYRFAELGHHPAGREMEAWAAQQRITYLSLYKAIANGGGSRTADVAASTDVADGTHRPRRRYLTRSA